jgi:hypothetical protein
MKSMNFAGMTVNERLCAAELSDEWTAAANSQNRARMIELLDRVDLVGQSGEIADMILANPAKYGY